MIMKWIKWRPPVKIISFSIIFLMLLLISVNGHFFRLYENALIRQTESELVAQGTAIATTYRFEILRLFEQQKSDIDYITGYGYMLPDEEALNAVALKPSKPLDILQCDILPPRPDGSEELRLADELAYSAGEVLTPYIRDIQQTLLSGITVVDYNGVVIASTNEETGKSLLTVEEIAKALEGSASSVLRKRELSQLLSPTALLVKSVGVRVFVALPVMLDNKVIGAVLLSRTPQNILHLLFQNRGTMLLAIVSLLCIVAVITLFAYYSIARPMSLLAKQAHTLLTRGGGQSLVKHPVTSEATQISGDLKKIGEQVERRSRYIRDFALYVSEAFRPLLDSVVEIAGHVKDGEKALDKMWCEDLEKIAEDGRRLEHLLERMRELADADLMLPTCENANLNHIIRQMIEAYQSKGLQITCEEMPQDNIIIQIASEALIKVFSQLCDNGIQHGADNVEITISLDADYAKIMFVDNGTGIAFDDVNKIFIPFFTTKKTEKNVGLGLALVYRLLEVHNGAITPIPSNRGAIFKISLPLVISNEE